MKLTETQRDRLTQLMDLGFGRTAAALSELTQLPVLIDPPSITTQSAKEMRPIFETCLRGDIATVHQIFSGRVSGNALLVLSSADAAILTSHLTHAPLLDITPRLDESSRDVLAEVGNILLNACLSVLGNLLTMPITFSVPRVSVGILDSMIRSLVGSQNEMQSLLLMRTTFRLHQNATRGYIVIEIGASSMDRLALALDQLKPPLVSHE